MQLKHTFVDPKRLKDKPDKRDFLFTPAASLTLPDEQNNTIAEQLIYDQAQEGSCTAQMICRIIDRTYFLNYGHFFFPSRNAQYYFTRLIEGNTHSDAGGSIRDAFEALLKSGLIPESLWPYTQADMLKKPNAAAVKAELKGFMQSYQSVTPTADGIMQALASGHTVGGGFTIHESFESDIVAKVGLIPMPKRGEAVLGGHALTIEGYNKPKQLFKIANSWGADWGQLGFCFMPYDFVLKYGSDFRILTAAESGVADRVIPKLV